MGSFPTVPNPPMLESLRSQRAVYECLKYIIAKMREIAQYVESTQAVSLPVVHTEGPRGYTTPPETTQPSGQPQSDLVAALNDLARRRR